MRRRIAVRMRARGAADFESYSRLLDSDPAEYEWLIAALTVNVTRLFRNVEAWDALARTVLPALWSAPSPSWSAGSRDARRGRKRIRWRRSGCGRQASVARSPLRAGCA